MRLTTCVLGLALAGLTAFSACDQVFGEDFPTRNVTILVPFTAGGPTDVIMRILGERLGARWGKPVIVENRTGAGTIVATAALARAEADGHTLGVVTNSFAVNPLAGDESDLQSCATGQWGNWDAGTERHLEQLPMAWLFALAAVGLLAAHLYLLAASKGDA